MNLLEQWEKNHKFGVHYITQCRHEELWPPAGLSSFLGFLYTWWLAIPVCYKWTRPVWCEWTHPLCCEWTHLVVVLDRDVYLKFESSCPPVALLWTNKHLKVVEIVVVSKIQLAVPWERRQHSNTLILKFFTTQSHSPSPLIEYTMPYSWLCFETTWTHSLFRSMAETTQACIGKLDSIINQLYLGKKKEKIHQQICHHPIPAKPAAGLCLPLVYPLRSSHINTHLITTLSLRAQNELQKSWLS